MKYITDTYSVEDLFTEYIFSLMKQKKNFMVFPDNKQILIEDEVDEWNKNHGLTDETERILYHYVEVKNNRGYIVYATEFITNIIIPIDVIEKDYNEFIKQIKEDLDVKNNKNENLLDKIYNNLQQDKVYGRMVTNVRYPYFDTVLYKTITGFIGWHNFGSSANKNTKEDLKWIIETIFKCTPKEFVETYECRNAKEIYNA